MDSLFPDPSRVDLVPPAVPAWARAKNAPGNQNPVARKYGFLGDPAVTPPRPRGRGVFEKAPLDSIPRGEIAVLQGHALNPDGSPDATSSGTVLVEVLGPPSRRFQITSFNGALIPLPYQLPGRCSTGGDDAPGRLVHPALPGADRRADHRDRAAPSAPVGGRREGVGLAADSLRIGSGLSSRVDQTPPTIRLLGLAGGDLTVAPGSVLTFELEDSSGIDLTRLDDAHSIFVIVDDRGTPIDLTASFRYEPSSTTRGTATLTLPPLAGGAHMLEVHASDTFRNVGTATS